ncbi:MAG: hypothetical protein ABL907_09680 [Hyphomicrobium sp.]
MPSLSGRAGSQSGEAVIDERPMMAPRYAYPDWKPDADQDPERSIAARKALLGRLATDRSRIIGFHLPFPGVGRVERKGATYTYVAIR